MYFNYALNFNMTVSSADNHFKQLGPRSGPTFCLDLIGVKLYEALEVMKIEVEPMYFNFVLNLNMTLSSADNPFR